MSTSCWAVAYLGDQFMAYWHLARLTIALHSISIAGRISPTECNYVQPLCRESSVPNCLTAYRGKYAVAETLPDGLHVQKIMAGQADRGAAACILECTAAGLQEGRYPPLPAYTTHPCAYTPLPSSHDPAALLRGACMHTLGR